MKMLPLDRQPVGSGPAADLTIRRERVYFRGREQEAESLSGGFCGGFAAAKTPYKAVFPLPEGM